MNTPLALRNRQPSQAARALLRLGRQRGWDVTVLGQAPLPAEPVRLGDWLVVPAQQDDSPMPERTQRRVQAIYASGLRPQGFVVVHEAPKLLPATIPEKPDVLDISYQPPARRQLAKLARALPGALLVGILAVSGALLLAALLAAIVAVASVLGVIALLGALVVIDRWWTSPA